MAATASIIIEVNDQGATQAFQRINAESANLGNNMRPIAVQSDAAFGSIAVGARKSREQVALLTEEMGISVPRAMRGVIAGMPGISSAINSAFTGLAIVGFIGIAESAGEAVVKLVERLTGWADETKRVNDSIRELQTALQAEEEKTKKLNEAYALMGLSGIPLIIEKQKLANDAFASGQAEATKLEGKLKDLKKAADEAYLRAAVPYAAFFGAREDIAKANDEVGKVENQINVLARSTSSDGSLTGGIRNVGKELSDAFSKEKAEGIRDIGVAAQEALTKLQSMTTAALKSTGSPEQVIAANLRAQEEEIANLLTFSGDEETVRRAAAAAVQAIEKKASDDRVKLLTEEYEKKQKLIDEADDAEVHLAQEQAVRMRHVQSETETEERNAAIAMAPPWEQANARIVEDYRQRMSRIKEMLDDGEIDEEQAGRRMAAAWQTAFGQMRDELANKMESLFNDLTSGNIGQAFLTMFKHLVFQMLATWIMGMQGMHAAASQTMTGSGGGILGSILGSLGLGGIFGGGGGGGGSQAGISSIPGVITNLGQLPLENSSGVISNLAGLGLSAGGGVRTGSTLPSGAGQAPAPGLGGLVSLIANSPLSQMLLMGGVSLLASSFGKGGAGGILGSMAGGAMIGSVIPGIGTIVGALVGGLVGLFSSLFGEHTGDKARKQVMEPLVAQIKVIQDSYDVFQTDYNTGISELEQLRADSIAALKKIGGRQVSGNTTGVNADIDAAEQHLKSTEAERMRRSQMDFGPAMFHTGGLVGSELCGTVPSWFAASALRFHGGGAVPAMLLPGEFVMQRSATERLGPGNLDRVNSGGSLGGDTHIYNINAVDAKSFEEFLDRGGGRKIKTFFYREAARGAL